MSAMTPDDVMCRYVEARGLRGRRLQMERAVLRALIASTDPDVQAYFNWLENEVAFCLTEHGDPFGRASSAGGRQ